MKTHPLSIGYLVVGLGFLGLAGSWALRATDVIDASDAEWLLPLVLVIAGGIGLVAYAVRGLTGRRGAPGPEADADVPVEEYDDLDAYGYTDRTTASHHEDTLVIHDRPTTTTDPQGENR
jgi:hypothetical protein